MLYLTLGHNTLAVQARIDHTPWCTTNHGVQPIYYFQFQSSSFPNVLVNIQNAQYALFVILSSCALHVNPKSKVKVLWKDVYSY